MKKLELVFVPLNVSSHLSSAIKLAKLLLDKDERLSITFLVILFPNQTQIDPNTLSLVASDPRIKFTVIGHDSDTINPLLQPSAKISIEKVATLLFESRKSHVEREVTKLIPDNDSNSIQLVGFVLDMFCTSMIDVANKFKVPSYIFFASNVGFLGFLLHLPIRGAVEFHPSDHDSILSSFQNPVPTDVVPDFAFDKTGGGYESFLYHATRFHESKGIIVNSFVELESYAVNSLISIAPTLYPVGPFVNIKENENKANEIKTWLDNQPPKSVLFLCFGNLGTFNEPQLAQIAIALERSGHRFIWSVRKPPPKDTHQLPTDYTNVEKVLPHGFLERVKDRGIVCGWAPQVEVLSHESVKGFVSHCGWNSILESLWFGVPIATWPMYSEQQLNAFLLVKELGLGAELSLSYRFGQNELVMADQIEKGINLLMDDANPLRERVKEMSEIGRNALSNGGSSYLTVEKLVEDLLHNVGENVRI